MHIVRVAPLAALPNTVPQVLDYFWATPLPRGALVQVMVGRRAITAIVLECLDLVRAKMAIKKSSFGLKKISSVLADTPQATAAQLSLCTWMAQQYHVPLGLCLKTILPAWLGKRGKTLQLPVVSLQLSVLETGNRKLETSPKIILTQPDTALETIKKTIGDGTTLLIVPEVHLAEYLARTVLASQQPLVVHSNLGIREQVASYQVVLSGQAKLIIGTRLSLFLPFQRLDRIIVEDPLHEAYKSDMAPRYATADVARELARLHGASLTYLTPALSTVNHYLVKQKALEFSDQKPYWPQIINADMTQERLGDNRTILSRHTKELLLDAYEDKRSILFFSPRRAYSSLLACKHCHKPLLCTTCDIPMRAHRTSEDMAVCYHCTAYINIPKQCPTCHAGALAPTGLAGSQKIAEGINIILDRHALPKIQIPILDSDLVRSEADESAVLKTFDEMQHPILIATQMMFSHRFERTFDDVVVVQADALTYNPDFRTQERLIYQLEKLVDFKPQTMILQSWDVHGAIAHASERSWERWYNQECTERKALGWPPFSRIIKLTNSHRDRATSSRQAALTADKLTRAAAHLKVSKSVSILGPAPALVEHAGGRWSQHILLKTTLSPNLIHQLLTYVPAGVTIDVDPRSVA